MNARHVVVIGAGPAGLTAAYKLSAGGCKVTVYEATPFVGGLSRSFSLWGQMVDLGPHRFFSKLKAVNALFFEILGADCSVVNRLTRIYFRQKFFSYPLDVRNSLSNLGPIEAIRCALSYLWSRSFGSEANDTFESWVSSRFGRRLFELFFKTYTEKVWGIPCSQIDADWAAQRIKKLSLYEAIKNALHLGGKSKHVSLVDRFNYPKGGTGSIYLKLQQLIESQGGRIFPNSPVEKITTEKMIGGGERATGVILASGETVIADEVVSTMPLTLMVQNLDSAPEEVVRAAKSLRYRNTILVYLKVPRADCFSDNWIYVHAAEVLHGRITNFRNWPTAEGLQEEISIICMEFWCFDEDQIWTESETRIGALARKELEQVFDWARPLPAMEFHVSKLRRTYPVYEIGYKKKLDPIIAYLETIQSLHPIGRYGAFKYNNQDHSLLMGLLAAKKILEGADVNLWSINTDSDYQESGAITASP